MDIKSKPLIRELKSFVKSNRSYAAKSGETDDVVMSSVLNIRILNEIQNWDDGIYNKLAEIIQLDDEDHDPLPMIVV